MAVTTWTPRATGGLCSACGMPLGVRVLSGGRTGYFHINVDGDTYHRRVFGDWERWTLTPAQ